MYSALNGKRILQVGWRSRGTRALKRLGAEVHVVVEAGQVDWGLDGEGIEDRLYCTDAYSAVENLFFLTERENFRAASFDGVIGYDEFALLPACVIAQHLGCSFYSVNLISRMRDKHLQKRAIRAAGISCASSIFVDDIRASAPIELPFPFVLKPYNGAGTKNTYVIHSESDLRSARSSARQSSSRAYVAETFIPGPEGHVDGLIEDGRICFMNIGEYLRNVIEIKSGAVLASVSSPRFDIETRTAAFMFVEKSLGALGFTNGVFHLEFFRNGRDWIFSEAAMRCGGAGIPIYHEVINNVDLFEMATMTGLGGRTSYGGELFGGRATFTGWTSLPSPAGVIMTYPSRQEVLGRPGVIAVEFEVPPGRTFPEMHLGSFVKIGSAVLEASTREEFEERQHDLTNWFYSSVKVT